MGKLKTIASEIFGLFVEDGSFAVTILLWVVAASIGLRFISHVGLRGPLLFLGLAAALIESVLRAARRRPPQ